MDDFEDEEVIIALLIEDDEVVVDVSQDEAVVELDASRSTIQEPASLRSNPVLDGPSNKLTEESSSEDVKSSEEFEEPDFVTDDVVVTSFERRRAAYSKDRSYSAKAFILIISGILTVFAIATLSILESPIYDVDRISIINTTSIPFSRIENEQMRTLVDTLKSDPMYRVKTKDIENDLAKIDTVRSIKIEKKWPSTLVVTVTRRMPRAYIETDRGVVLVDDQGMVYQRAKLTPTDLPVFDGIDEVTFGSRIDDKTFVEVLDSAPAEIKNQIARVAFDDGDYVAELGDGIDIVLGDSSQLKEKLAIAWSILNTKKRSDLGYIDVSVPSLPVSGSPQLKV